MTDRALLDQPASSIELRRHDHGTRDSFYTRAGSILMLETYEAIWIGHGIALMANGYEPET